jgi:hypothetical protein
MRIAGGPSLPLLMEGSKMNHPDHLMMITRLRLAEAERQHRHREGLARRPRPPGRARQRVANTLVRLAARLTDEPVVALPHRLTVR